MRPSRLMKPVKILALATGCVAVVLLARLAFHGHTPAFHHSPHSIASLEKLRLGGADQYILIRGKDVSNPLILFLHGGPGMPTMYLAHAFQRPLEKDFVVVQWDRRGAGKSYSGRIPAATMSVRQEISDTRELVDVLRQRFQKDKVYLVGFSYGSYLGLLATQRFPELFHAYVGVGQEACSAAEERQIQDKWIRREALARGNQQAMRQIEGKEPLDRERWLFEFGGELHRQKNWRGLLWDGLTAPEYTLRDILKLKAGVNFTARNFKYDAIDGALMDRVTSIDVPVYFFTGRFDYADPIGCTERYFNRLDAPRKEIIWFEQSAHFPFLEEPEKFAQEMRRVAAGTGHQN